MEELENSGEELVPEARRHGLTREVWEWVKTLLWAGVLFWVLRSQVVEARLIPSESMVPTLEVNDRLITDKLLYRFTGLKRGDIVVFTPPVPSTDPYIKRVIGLPGDKVAVRDGKVFVNGVALDEPYIAEKPAYRLPETAVPDGHLLVLGDNRNHSADSHVWGLLARDKVMGRAVFRYWPFDRIGVIR